MQSAQILNLGAAPAKPNSEPEPVQTERGHINDWMEQTGSAVRRHRMELDHQEQQHETHHRRIKALAIALGVVILALVAAIFSAYPALQVQTKAIGQLVGLQTAGAAMDRRVQSVETTLEQRAVDMPAVSNRLDQLQTSMKAGLQTARTQAQAAATQMGQRIRQDFTQTVQAIQSRLAGLESNQRESSERVTQLQDQIAKLQGEVTGLRQEASAANDKVKQLEEQQQASSNAVTNLDKKMSTNQSALATLTTRIDQTKTDFDVPVKQTHQIAPNLYLSVSRADEGKQEIDGALQLAANSRMLPLRQQGVARPMTFYTGADERPSQLVLTKVTKNRVSGYVLTPAAPKQD